jgi:hypothetical protein
VILQFKTNNTCHTRKTNIVPINHKQERESSSAAALESLAAALVHFSVLKKLGGSGRAPRSL